MTDHYAILGVDRSATPDDIKAAYRCCSSTAHPDRPGGSAERMAAVNVAYAVLSDPERRLRYDHTGKDAADDLEALARAELEKGIDHAIEAHGVNALSALRQGIVAAVGYHDKMHRDASAEIAKFTRQLGRVKVKAGRNLFEEVLKRKIAAATHKRGQVEEAQAVHKRMREMLAEYEDPEPEAQAVRVQQYSNYAQNQQLNALAGVFVGGS